jgi:hypothetical protein
MWTAKGHEDNQDKKASGGAGINRRDPARRVRHYQAIGDRKRAIEVAKDAAPYMHPRLHAVAGAGGVPTSPADGGQSLAAIARKVALAFYLTAREDKAGLIEDAGDGARPDSA